MVSNERRGNQRYSTNNARVRCYSFDSVDWYQVKNVSERGLCLQEGRHLPVGAKVRLEFVSEEWNSLVVQGEVVRSNYQVGVVLSHASKPKDWMHKIDSLRA